MLFPGPSERRTGPKIGPFEVLLVIRTSLWEYEAADDFKKSMECVGAKNAGFPGEHDGGGCRFCACSFQTYVHFRLTLNIWSDVRSNVQELAQFNAARYNISP